jgi:SM-20-related protein
MIANMRIESSDIKAICENLSQQAWSQCTGLFDIGLLHDLHDEALQHELAENLGHAAIGRDQGRVLSSLRGDSTLWLDDPRCGAASKAFVAELELLRKALNQSLLLGLETVEAHFAVYPAGAGYARHRDRFRDDDARVLSLVCYLNKDWPRQAGGELRLHLPGGVQDISPEIGTSVVFLSADIEHEVLPATQTRYSIAAWFRRREIQLR